MTYAGIVPPSISNFSSGLYVQWNLSGHVHIKVTLTASQNAVVSGAFFGGGSGNIISTRLDSTPNPSDSGEPITFTAAVRPPAGPNETAIF